MQTFKGSRSHWVIGALICLGQSGNADSWPKGSRTFC